MKYTTSIEIALPREKVVKLLAEPAYMPKWLRGLVLHEPVNGAHGRLVQYLASRVSNGEAEDGGHRDHHAPGT